MICEINHDSVNLAATAVISLSGVIGLVFVLILSAHKFADDDSLWVWRMADDIACACVLAFVGLAALLMLCFIKYVLCF